VEGRAAAHGAWARPDDAARATGGVGRHGEGRDSHTNGVQDDHQRRAVRAGTRAEGRATCVRGAQCAAHGSTVRMRGGRGGGPATRDHVCVRGDQGAWHIPSPDAATHRATGTRRAKTDEHGTDDGDADSSMDLCVQGASA
jgi:hypothetical protein